MDGAQPLIARMAALLHPPQSVFGVCGSCISTHVYAKMLCWDAGICACLLQQQTRLGRLAYSSSLLWSCPDTYHVEVQICFQPKFILHVNFYSKPYKMRYISWNSNGHLLRYGNPDMLFLGTLKNKFHFQWFLTINKQNMVLLFWSGFPFDLNITEFA